MSTSFNYRLPTIDHSFQIPTCQADKFEHVPPINIPRPVCGKLAHAQNTPSTKKKVLNTNKSKENSFGESPPKLSSYKDFITPDKLEGLKERLAAFIENSTAKNEERRRRVAFELDSLKSFSGDPMNEKDFLKTPFLRTVEKRRIMVVDTTKISNEKEKLLQSTSSSSVKEVIKSQAIIESPKSKLSEVETIRNASVHKKVLSKKAAKEIGKESRLSDKNKEFMKTTSIDQDSSSTKRNFRQLAPLPQVRQEDDSLSNSFSTKTVKRTERDVLPKTITFFDKRKNQYLKFPVVAEKDLNFNHQRLSECLHATDMDDDFETNEEQLDLGKAKVFEDLLEGIGEQDGKRYRPRYPRDPDDPSRRIFTYAVFLPNAGLRLPAKAAEGGQENITKTLCSASTSDRSINSWKSQGNEEKMKLDPTYTQSSNSYGRSVNTSQVLDK